MNTQTSPFKFLDSYEQKDADIFFGRESETEALYDALSGVKHLLVYGPSGAGKTSLIECGLRNQFSDADWYALSIRRGKDMISSTFARINEALDEKLELDPETGQPNDNTIGFGQAIERLFNERFQPVYLLFDQFEELLISGSEEERKDFFTRLNKLIRYKVPCRVILIMREEFIGHLSEFEVLCPTIFQHRFRLEKMTRAKVQKVIESILDAPYYEQFFEVDEPEELASTILQKLPDDRKEIDLSHVQVFLSELWDRSLDRGGFQRLPLLDLPLIREKDNLEGVLNSFLKKQLSDLAEDHGDELPLEVLAVMISERFTKLQVDQATLVEELNRRKVQLPSDLDPLLLDLERRRIIRKLKSGDQTQYEISHDTLALVIGQNLTEEMQLRQKAEDIYTVYLEREGYFSQEDLDLIRPYNQYLPYPRKLAERLKASEAHLKAEEEEKLRKAQEQLEKEQALRGVAEDNANRARTRTRIAAIVAVVALVAAGAALWYYFDAEKQKEIVLKNGREIIRKDSLNRIERFNRFQAEAKGLQEQGAYSQALDKFELAKEFTDDTAMINLAIDSCKIAAGNQIKFEELLLDADRKRKQEAYSQAISDFEEAILLEVNPTTIRLKLSEIQVILRDKASGAEEIAEAYEAFDADEARKYKGQASQYRRQINRIQNLLNKL